jgi:hypothetical protein
MRRLAVPLAALVMIPVLGVSPAHAAGDQITVHIQPSTLYVGDTPIGVSGVVTDSTSGTPVPVPDVSVTIQRSDHAGPYAPVTVTTDGSGAYSYSDTAPAVWKTLTYTVSLTSDMSQTGQGSTWVRRLPTTLTVAASKSLVRSGNDVRITAHLGTTATNRTVAIYAKPYHLDRFLVVKHDVDANGNLTATPTVHRRTTYIAHFGGDDTYAPTHAAVVVTAQAVVTERLYGGYATVNGMRLYHATGVPVLAAHLRPQLADRCLWFKAQRRGGDGAWHTVAVKCFRTDAYGRAEAKFTGDHRINVPYRVRARWTGATVATAAAGPWFRLEFR